MRQKGLIMSLVFLGAIIMMIAYSLQSNVTNTHNEFIIGVLASNDLRLNKLEGLKSGLKRFEFKKGSEVRFIIKNAQSKRDKLLPLAKELVNNGVDVIVTTGRVETEVAKKVTESTEIPIVFMGLTALTEDALVVDLLRPRQKITGVQNDHAALSGKRLELLKKLIPDIKNVLVIYDPSVVPAAESLRATQNASQKLNLKIKVAAASSQKDIKEIFEEDITGIDSILLLPSFFLENQGAKMLAPLAMDYKLPVMAVEHGTKAELFAFYGITPYKQGEQAARIVAKILNGYKIEDIPVEPPAELVLTINMEVAQRLGIEVNETMLGYAELIYPESRDDIYEQ